MPTPLVDRTAAAPDRGRRAAGWRHAACFLLMLLLLEAASRRGGDWFDWTASTAYNPALQEGLAWRLGRLDLRYHLNDTALMPETGRVYNVYPPLQSLVGFVLALASTRGDHPPAAEEMAVYHAAAMLLFFAPLTVLGYVVFFQRTRSAIWAAVLGAGLIGGTALSPCIDAARRDDFHHVNHLLATMGLLVLAGEALGKRRAWVMMAGLLVAAWSRQLTGVFAVPLVLMALWRSAADGFAAPAVRPRRFRADGRVLVGIALALTVIIGVPMGLNHAKFGSPFESGYRLIYEGRDTRAARNAHEHGLFSTAFVPVNAFYMNLATPWTLESNGGDGRRFIWRPSPDGGSVWLGTPLAALALMSLRRVWADAAARWLMLCTVPIVIAHLLYHNTGYVQHGYYRFALDYLPVWLVVAAPWLSTGWRRAPTLLCIGWSLAYFSMVRHWTGPGLI